MFDTALQQVRVHYLLLIAIRSNDKAWLAMAVLKRFVYGLTSCLSQCTALYSVPKPDWQLPKQYALQVKVSRKLDPVFTTIHPKLGLHNATSRAIAVLMQAGNAGLHAQGS